MSEIKGTQKDTIIKNKIGKLIDVKSIVTITLVATLVIVILAGMKVEDNMFQLFSNAVMLVLGFFFGKNNNEKKSDKIE